MKSSIKLLIASLMLAGAGGAFGQSCAGMSLGENANLNGFVPFPADSAWNTDIASAPVDPNSDAITSVPGFAGLHLHPDFEAGSKYGIPYVVVDSTKTPSTPIHVTEYASQSDVVAAPFPADAPIEGNPADCDAWPSGSHGDAHVLVLDRAKCELYETFNTHRCNGQWEASSETIWDMKKNEARPWGWTSGDAAGLPIFPGLVRYDEVASGAIHHALRFTMKFTKGDRNGGYFVAPATHAAGNNWGTRNVMGMRIRLKAGFDISGFPKVDQIILTAMKQYGMILADNGGYFFFSGVSDPRFNEGDLIKLSQVQSSNFEVVQTSPAYPGYDSETVPHGPLPKIASFKTSASSVKPGSAVTLSYDVSGDSYDYIDRIGPVAPGSGSVTINPTTTQTYTLNSANAFGRTTSTPLTVTVAGSVVATPVFAPPAGAYNSAQTVTIADSTTDATIYYTTNGSTPTGSSTKYAGALTVSATETIRAIAAAAGQANSTVASAAYTIISLPSVVAAPAKLLGTTGVAMTVMANSFGLPGSYLFQYGTSSTALSSSTGAIGLSGSTGFVTVSAKVAGLKSGQTYYYRAVVTTAGGTATGAVLSFTTN